MVADNNENVNEINPSTPIVDGKEAPSAPIESQVIVKFREASRARHEELAREAKESHPDDWCAVMIDGQDGSEEFSQDGEDLMLDFFHQPMTNDGVFGDYVQSLAEQLELDWTPELQEKFDDQNRADDLKPLYDDLRAFRKKFSVLNYSGTTFVYSVNPKTEHTPEEMVFQGVGDFHNYNLKFNHDIEYEDDRGITRTKKVFVSKMFMEDKFVRHYDGVHFVPARSSDNRLNLWKGWNIAPKAGNIKPFLMLISALCNDDKDCEEYLLNYLAHMVQKPAEKPEVAVVMKGAQGIGKGTLMKLLGSFNDNYKHLSSTNSLVGDFSGHLIDAFIVFADEAVWAGDKTSEGRLKAMVTEDRLSIRAMRKDEIYVRNFIRLFVASNEDWVVPVGEGDRRFFVLECSPRYKGQTGPNQFFGKFAKWVDEGGDRVAFHYLKTRDISQFNTRVFPKTQARVEQNLKGLGHSARFIYEVLNGTAALSDDTMTKASGQLRLLRNQLYQDMKDWCGTRVYAPNSDEFGKTMAKAFDFPSDEPSWRTKWDKKVDGKHAYYYQLPSLKVGMERFAKNLLDVDPKMVFFSYAELEEQEAIEQSKGKVTELKTHDGTPAPSPAPTAIRKP